MKLLKAHYFIKDYTVNGIPVWWEDSDRVSFEVKKRVSRSQAAVQRAEKSESGKGKVPPPGRYYVPEPYANDGGPMPTFKEWIVEQREKNARKQ